MRKKLSIAFGLGLALVAMAIGITFTYSHDSSVLENTFGIAQTRVQFIDTFNSPSNWIPGQTVPKEIKVKNETGVPVVARVKLTETWDSKDGVGLPLVGAQSNVRMAIINYTENSGWTLDGTWWYSPVLQPGETSTSLITGVTLNVDADLGADWRYGGATYKLSAKAEVIQSDLAATEWHKKVIVSATNIAKQLYKYNNNQGGSYNFVKSVDKPSFIGTPIEDRFLLQDTEEGSNMPLYVWTSGIYALWYAEVDDIYLTDGSFYDSYFIRFRGFEGFRDFNTSMLTSMNRMFEYTDSSSLSGLETWDVSNVTSLKDTFYNGGSGYINDVSALSRWDVSNVTIARYMLSGHKVVDISPLAAWNVRNIDDFYYMFVHNKIDGSICSLADWPIKRDAYGYGMFDSNPDTYPVDARCLEPWNINSSNYDWFPSNKYTKPSWAN